MWQQVNQPRASCPPPALHREAKGGAVSPHVGRWPVTATGTRLPSVLCPPGAPCCGAAVRLQEVQVPGHCDPTAGCRSLPTDWWARGLQQPVRRTPRLRLAASGPPSGRSRWAMRCVGQRHLPPSPLGFPQFPRTRPASCFHANPHRRLYFWGPACGWAHSILKPWPSGAVCQP